MELVISHDHRNCEGEINIVNLVGGVLKEKFLTSEGKENEE
jgi:hypothetical protein